MRIRGLIIPVRRATLAAGTTTGAISEVDITSAELDVPVFCTVSSLVGLHPLI